MFRGPGCGSGRTIDALPDRFVPFGIEISLALAAKAQRVCERRGGTIIRGAAVDVLRRLEEGSFDGVIMRAYLEHEADPLEALRGARRTLRPGGRIIIKAPNYGSFNRRFMGRNWCALRLPCHVNDFTPATLRRLVRQADLEIASFGIFHRFPLSDNMWLVAERPAASPGARTPGD